MKTFRLPLLIVATLFVSACSINPGVTDRKAVRGDFAATDVYGQDVKVEKVKLVGEDEVKVTITMSDLGKFADEKEYLASKQFNMFIGDIPDLTQKGVNNQNSSNSPAWAQENKHHLFAPAKATRFYAGVYDMEERITKLLQARGVYGMNGDMPQHLLQQLSFGETDLILDGGLTGLQPHGGIGGGAEADRAGVFATTATIVAQYTYHVKRAIDQEVLYTISLEVDVTKYVEGLDISGALGSSKTYKHLDVSSAISSSLSGVQNQQSVIALARATGFLSKNGDVVTGIPYPEGESYAYWKAEKGEYNSLLATENKLKSEIYRRNVLSNELKQLSLLLDTKHDKVHSEFGANHSHPEGSHASHHGKDIESDGHGYLLTKIKQVSRDLSQVKSLDEARVARSLKTTELGQVLENIKNYKDELNDKTNKSIRAQVNLHRNGIQVPKYITTVGEAGEVIERTYLKVVEDPQKAEKADQETVPVASAH